MPDTPKPSLDEMIGAITDTIMAGEQMALVTPLSSLTQINQNALRAALDTLREHERVVAERDRAERNAHYWAGNYREVILERDAARAELAAFREANGHNAPCVMCNEPCSALAGNPGLWPVRLGNDGWRHVACINKALAELAEARTEIEDWKHRAIAAEATIATYPKTQAEVDELETAAFLRGRECREKYPEVFGDAPPPDDAMEAATKAWYETVDPEPTLTGKLQAFARAITVARAAEREKYAPVVEALKRIWPWFEGEHYHDHPDAVFVRNVLAALDGGQQ